MCGIAGFVDFRNGASGDSLAAMTGCAPHRGPDGSGTRILQTPQAGVGLGHRRLAIIDPGTASDQPMTYRHLHLVFNGELYNYQELREELRAKGHQFATGSDTEVLLHCWEEWGEAAIDRWRGMFAFALFDERQQELICVRDRPGTKPFFYCYNDDLFLFGSELKNLMAHPAFARRIDPPALAAYLRFGYVPQPYSIFQHTRKLAPGHLLRFSIRSRQLTLRRYWNVYDAYNQPKLQLSLPEAIGETERILTESFRYRLVADVPVGLFLSGGYDSTCVAALLQKSGGPPLQTFTIGMPDSRIDEAPHARAVARHLGTRHTEYYCTQQDALQLVEQLPYFYDEPFADSSAIPTLLLSRLARKDVRVALSADGGDEVFGGYNRYDYIRRFGKPLRALPAPLRRGLSALLSRMAPEQIPVLRRLPGIHSRYDKLRNLLADPSAANLLLNLTSVFGDDELSHLLAAPTAPHPSAHNSNELQSSYYDDLSFMMAADWQTYLTDDILQKVDRATMAASLEGREPFLDQHIIEWAARLPTHFKYFPGQKKYILRAIVHRHVPKALMDRPKTGFGIPLADWMRGVLAPLIRAQLQPGALGHDFFDPAQVDRLLRSFFNGRNDRHLQVWHLFQFQLWYRKWMS